MDNLVTCNSIMEWFNEQVELKKPISPDIWLDGASKMNVLIGSEHEKLYELEQAVSIMERSFVEKTEYSAAKAKVFVKAEDIYKQMQVQKAKIEQIEEFIRLAKHRARRAGEEFKNN